MIRKIPSVYRFLMNSQAHGKTLLMNNPAYSVLKDQSTDAVEFVTCWRQHEFNGTSLTCRQSLYSAWSDIVPTNPSVLGI
jgi:hypothetical protein